MIVYLDTSTVLQALVGRGTTLSEWGQWERAYTSGLMGVEARRALDRLRLEQALDDDGLATAHEALGTIESAIGAIRLTAAVLRRASRPMATVVKTLDAIHLASALLFEEHRQERMVFATHDRRQGVAARALGLQVIGTA
ncbi:MAG: PIN domain-containing protein [Vicinamibacterales bacterium]|nr:PIN domain-containing protein [Vicinamibacterales bacterium]MDP7478118.1 PIN domain-containing protein [Vicinamibacterales bacterium]